jgi:flavodoxin
MKVLVTYFSQTGNTKKIAEAMYDEIDADKDIKELSEVESLEDYDLSFIGSPIVGFGPAQQLKDFLAAYAAGNKIVLFITHGAPEDQPQVQDWLDECRKAASGAELVGLFDCQGELSQQVAEMLMKSDNPEWRAWGEGRDETIGQPDETRVQRAREFAREIMEKV